MISDHPDLILPREMNCFCSLIVCLLKELFSSSWLCIDLTLLQWFIWSFIFFSKLDFSIVLLAVVSSFFYHLPSSVYQLKALAFF